MWSRLFPTFQSTGSTPRYGAAIINSTYTQFRCPFKDPTSATSRESANPQEQYARRPKTFNMNTYKLHSLGDYTDAIRNYGTTDSYSTQIVSVIAVIAEPP